MSFDDLAKKSARLLEREVPSTLLMGSIKPYVGQLLQSRPEETEDLCQRIADQNPKAFPDTVIDRRERAAYTLAAARWMDTHPTTH